MSLFQGIKVVLGKIIGTGKKILLVIIVFFGIISIFLNVIRKDTQIRQTSYEDNYRSEVRRIIAEANPKSSKNAQASLYIFKGINCVLLGEACTGEAVGQESHFQKSFAGRMTKLMSYPIMNPPASGVNWTMSELGNAGFIPKTMAAEGIGFGAIKPFNNLWKTFRNFSYLILVIILVSIGFMIMFRTKINPQTVISIENSLPKIITTLIIITFSFAIAGFLIDLMYVIIALAINLLSGDGKYYNAAEMQNKYFTAGIGQIFESLLPYKNFTGIPFFLAMGNSMLSLLGPIVHLLVRIIMGLVLGFFNHNVIMSFLEVFAKVFNGIGISLAGFGLDTGQLPQLATQPIFLIVSFIIGMALGFAMMPQLVIGALMFLTIVFLWFRIFFMLFRSYLQIILMIIFAPLILLGEAIPGKSTFNYWLKNLLAELLAFPVVIILFLAGYDIVNTMSSGANIWTPPLIQGADANTLTLLIGLGILMLIPDFVKMVKEMMGVKGLPVSLGLGTFFAGATTGVAGGVGLLGQISSVSLGMKALGINSLQDLIPKGGKPPTGRPGKGAADAAGS